jgi:hypothetical protein
MDGPTALSWLGLFPLCMGLQPLGSAYGVNYEEMKQDFEAGRDKEFASHACRRRNRKYLRHTDAVLTGCSSYYFIRDRYRLVV